VADDLAGSEARAQTQRDDAARRCSSDEIEGIADPDIKIRLQTREDLCGKQCLGPTAVKGENLETIGARIGRLVRGRWMNLRVGFASSP
jgi:hypothetical protein